MDIYKVLEGENSRIRQALEHLPNPEEGPDGEGADSLRELRARLLAEKEVEESFLYPVMLNLESTRKEAQALMREQADLVARIEEVASADKRSADYPERIEVLRRKIVVYLDCQERKLFELVRRAIPADQAEDLGARVKEGLARVHVKYRH